MDYAGSCEAIPSSALTRKHVNTLSESQNKLERISFVNFDNNLRCPEISPWLQKFSCKKIDKGSVASGGRTHKEPINYSLLRWGRLKNKYSNYYEPLTIGYRYYDETECYMEEYRMYKSPSLKQYQTGVNYVPATGTLSSSTSNSSPKSKHKKTRLNRTRNQREEEPYLNNAKVSSSGNSSRVAIKIPKCETKHRRTIFPVILSRYHGINI